MTDVWAEIAQAYEGHTTVVANREYMRGYMRDWRAEHRHQPEPKEARKAEVPPGWPDKKRLMAGR